MIIFRGQNNMLALFALLEVILCDEWASCPISYVLRHKCKLKMINELINYVVKEVGHPGNFC